MIKLETTLARDLRSYPYGSCRRQDVYSGRHSAFYAKQPIFYILTNDLWQPRWETEITGRLFYCIYHSCPSSVIKTQRVRIILSQPLGVDTVEKVVQSSSKVLTSLTSLLLDDIDPTSLLHHFLFLTLTSAYWIMLCLVPLKNVGCVPSWDKLMTTICSPPWSY